MAKGPERCPREDWHVFIKDHHASYVSFEEFEENERTLRENNTQRKSTDQKTPPREGPALIQGLVWCGKCGHRMTVRYSYCNGRQLPYYVCQKDSVACAEKVCQHIHGQAIDAKITELLISKLTPEIIDQTVSVQKELDKRQDETLNYYRMRVDKCRYEADLARRRFMSVDPDNRLVALELESNWNVKLSYLDNARDEYDHQAGTIERTRNERDYSTLDNLADNFSEIFSSDSVSWKDKKRMARYLIEDVTLARDDRVVKVQIRYRGHTTQSVTVDAPRMNYENWTTDPEVIKLVGQAAETLSAGEIAVFLNKRGFRSGKDKPFTPNIVKRIMSVYSIPNMKERYLDRGYINGAEKAASMGITTSALMYQIRSGKYDGEYVRINSRNECVFPPEIVEGTDDHARNNLESNI